MRIISSFPNPFPFKNMAVRQRLIFLSRRHELTFLTRSQVEIPAEFSSNTRVLQCPFHFRNDYLDRLVYLLWAVLLLVTKLRGDRFALAYSFHELSSFLLGYLPRQFGLAHKWTVDYLDDPILEYYNWSQRDRNRLLKMPVLLLFKLIDRLYKIIFKKADLCIVQGVALSDQLPRTLRAKYGISDRRIILVPNGVDLEGIKAPGVLPPGRPGFTIFYVGYISKLRGVGLLLEVAEKLTPEIPDLRLVLVGWTKEEDRVWLQDEIQERGLAGKVEYLGVQPSEVVWDLISQAAVCVFPFQQAHLSYVFPVKIFEYLALGRPVVASRLEGISRIISDGVNGLLADPYSVAEWTTAILRLYREPKLRAQLMANARPSIASYDWRLINGYIEQELQRLFQ